MLFVYEGDSEHQFLRLNPATYLHADAQSGPFNHREYCWLVMWEPKVILQVPPGVFVQYPSALLHHFNVDITGKFAQLPTVPPPLTLTCTDFNWVTTLGGELPTKDNSEPLCCPEDGGRGRGSMVWYSQATMFQSSELGAQTVKKFMEQHGETSGTSSAAHCNANEMVQNGFFPVG